MYHLMFVYVLFKRKFASNSSGGGIFGGSGDFSATEMLTSQYNLKEACKKYKFALMPKVCIT